MTKIILTVPEKDNALIEFRNTLTKERADIYIFPEGFLLTEQLEEALAITKEFQSFVVTGLKDTRSGERYETALIIDSGKIVGEYKKCILTKSEREKGKVPGEYIHCIDTKVGKIGIPICYEIHFPEVSRIMALEEPVLLVNLIGTGMYHDLQFSQWTALARTRAIENEVFVMGCSHFVGELPIAFAYSPQGEILFQEKNRYGSVCIEVDLEDSKEKKINYFADRRPHCFERLSE
uniref:carbon-nitrogen hydrolase family protein n=1 Tax=Acetatifactor sp. TaxID=1872090 RepID=UPI0040563156